MNTEPTSPLDDASQWWRNGITRIQPGEIAVRGYPIEDLITEVAFVDMIWLLLRGDLPTGPQAALLEAALVASVDHGPQAPSIAAARMATTCGVGLNNAMATGVNLLGDVHGGAGQQCMELLASLTRQAEDKPLVDAVADVVDGARQERRYLPGFGHRFHPHDPRCGPLLDKVDDAVADGNVPGQYLKAARLVEQRLNRVTRSVPMNIDGATAVVYLELGFPPELGRGLFVLSRSVGVLAHAWEERQSGTRIKGPMPRSILAHYDGPELRNVPRRASPAARGEKQ